MDLADQPHFFVGAAMGLGIGGVVGPAIDGAVSIGIDVVAGSFGLSL